MKYFVWFIGVIAAIAVTIYIVVFTSLGNGLIKPVIEQKINSRTQLDSRLIKFTLTPSEFEILLELNKNNTILLKGHYSVFSKAFNMAYRVQLENLETLKSLTKTPLRGHLHTEGSVKGDMSYMEVNGKSDIGDSDTTYHIELTDLNPTSIIANVAKAKLSSLLYLGVQSQYANADIDLNVNFKNINPGKLDGDVVLKTSNGVIDSKLMKKDFDVTIPNTSFNMNLDAKLKGDDIDYAYVLSSNLFKVLSSGNVIPKPFKSDVKYSLNISELAVLKPVIGSDLRGSFKLNGTVKGTKEKLLVNGESDFSDSDTKFQVQMKDFAAKSVVANVKHLKIDKLLYMLKQPKYTDGTLSLNAEISDVTSGALKGNIITVVKNGILNSNYLTKAYKFKSTMPRTVFNSTITTKLSGDIADSQVDFNSNLVNLDAKNAIFNIKRASLKSDYVAQILNLDKLFFITDRHMKGSVSLNGDVSKNKDLDLTMHTKVAGGDIDVKLHNDDLNADIESVDTKEILHMLIYPEIFGSTIDGSLDYNLAQSKGVFSAKVKNGNFVNNKTFNLVKKYTKFDMYRETFNGDVKAKINKEHILATIDLRSKQASIKTFDAKLNSKAKTVDADLTLQSKKDTIAVNLRGDIESPKVSIDLEKLMKSQTGEKVEKVINKFLNKLFE